MLSFLQYISIAFILLIILYKYGTRNFDYWKKRGVKDLSPIPFLGDNYTMKGFFYVLNPFELCDKFYKPFKGERFGGINLNMKPFLSLVDPEMVKLVLVKDAEYFLNRYDWFVGTDPLFCANLINLKDDAWKKMRTVMSTVFTSAKMKDMFVFMDECGKQSVEYLDEKVTESFKSKESEKSFYEMECRDFFSRYGTDVIGSTAFGIEVNSFKNPDNEFHNSGYAVRKAFTGWNLLKLTFIVMFSGLAKTLGITVLGAKYTKFFSSLISDTIREREEKNIVRKDLIHILMEARKGKGLLENGELIKGKLPELTNFEIAAQALVFFLGGFETMSTLLGFVTYELACNPDVQEKLQEEIDEVIAKENGVTYDGVMHQMQYLNMVVNETLRKWPPAMLTDREVSKTYVIPKTDTSPEIVLQRGDAIWVSISSFHYDPEYFPDPQKFDPERFRDEKSTIKPYTYLPFGFGLRHCIGMRYALMVTKTILVHTLMKYSFVPSEKTSIPMKLNKKRPLALEPENGFWLGIKPRK